MIQIQDDVNNVGDSFVAAPVTPASTPVTNTPATSVSDTGASTRGQTAEIDRLLAELDKLSKELEAERVNKQASTPSPTPVVPTPVVAQTQAPVSVAVPEPAPLAKVEPVPVPTPVTNLTMTPTQASAPTKPASAEANKEPEEDKFDFDAFLADLEKKIEAESQKKQAEPVDEVKEPLLNQAVSSQPVSNQPVVEDVVASNNDFRAERASVDLSDEEPAQSEKPADLAEEPIDEPVATQAPTISQAVQETQQAQDASEELKDQNIFEMLGLAKISDEEKNQFLDELESMIWQDFVQHDLELLLTSSEYTQARQILDAGAKNEDQKKEELIVFLEKLIPDLDEVLYEKALQLKAEMMQERLGKAKDGASPELATKLQEIEQLIADNKWRSASNQLNAI